MQSHKKIKNKRNDLDMSSTSIQKVPNPISNPAGGLLGSRKFGNNLGSSNLNVNGANKGVYKYGKQTPGLLDDYDEDDDTQSVGFVRKVGASDFDDQSSFMSLGGGDGYSDIESSGGIIKMSSKNSESSYNPQTYEDES